MRSRFLPSHIPYIKLPHRSIHFRSQTLGCTRSHPLSFLSFPNRFHSVASAQPISQSANAPVHDEPSSIDGSLSEFPTVYATHPSHISQILRDLQQHESIGVDTEFTSFGFYSPKPQLLQISTPTLLSAIDLQLIRDDVKEILEALMSKELILHGHRGDLSLLFHLCKKFKAKSFLPSKIFDTQIAAAALGWGNTIGYGALNEVVFGVKLDKGNAFSDWDRRPLSPSQLSYAINDVRHLHHLKDRLVKELKSVGRLDAALCDMEYCLHPSLYEFCSPDTSWRSLPYKVKNIPDKSVYLAVVKEVSSWRETVALSRNWSPMSLLRHESLITLGLSLPASFNDLSSVQAIKPLSLSRFGVPILESVKKGLSYSPSEYPRHQYHHRDAGRFRPELFNLFSARLAFLSRQHSIAPNFLCPAYELIDISSVSSAAFEAILETPESELKPNRMPSIVWGMRSENIPKELSTLPDSYWDENRWPIEPFDHSKVTMSPQSFLEEINRTISTDSPANVSNLNSTKYPFTVEEEIQMLKKLKILSGWRRDIIGMDLLRVAAGQSLQWNGISLGTEINGGFNGAAKEVCVWAEAMPKAKREAIVNAMKTAVAVIEEAKRKDKDIHIGKERQRISDEEWSTVKEMLASIHNAQNTEDETKREGSDEVGNNESISKRDYIKP